MNSLYLNRKFQKNRFFSKQKKINFKYGDAMLVISKEGRIEMVYLSIIKYFLKNCLKKKKKSLQVNEKIWYFGRINFFLQKKSKNSRMGKGKGMLERAVIRVKKNFCLFEFKGFSECKLKKFYFKINKKLNLNFYMCFKQKKNYSLWCYRNNYINYFDKYLLY